jgi:hypothetical protein
LVAVLPDRWEKGHQHPHGYNLQQLSTVYEVPVEELAPGFSVSTTTARPLPEVPDDESAVSMFLKTNLTMRLLSLMDASCSYAETYREFMQILEEGAMISRRKAIEAIAILATYPTQILKLSPSVANTSLSAETVLHHCTPGVIASWELSRSKELALALSTISSYIPTLQHLVQYVSSSQQRKDAAHLQVQCLLMKTRLVRDLQNSHASLPYALQAKQYSEVAADPILQILAVRTLACSQYFANQWEQAATTVKQASHILTLQRDTPIPPIVRSYVHSGLATYQAQIKQKDTALQSLQVMHTSYYAQSSAEPPPIWVDHSLTNLFCNDGLTHMHLNMYKDACFAFEKMTHNSGSRPQKVHEASINRALVEINRDDQPRDMALCIAYWTQGIQGAIALHDELHFNIALQAYTAMRAVWPTESRIKELQSLIVHW